MTQGTIIILGDIGKNFGAGMTGGIAFVYTKNKTLTGYINTDYINESKLEKRDVNLVIRFIRNHVFHTGSSLGKRVVDNWDKEKHNFIKLTPKAMAIVDLDKIYNSQVADRMGILLNE